MHIGRFNHLILLFSIGTWAKAQDWPTTLQDDHPFGPTFWASAADSVDFTAFRSALQLTDTSPDLDTTTVVCRAVWRIGEHGGLAVVSRGDGSLMQIKGSSFLGLPIHIPFRLPDGRRGFMVVHETPCGLICRDTVYYLEE